jgi:DNA-binding PadR family transcriptional regulator
VWKVHGYFEQVVLIAVATLGSRASGAAVMREVRRRLARDVQSGPIHVTLQRLVEKDLIASGLERRRIRMWRWYTIKEEGLDALREARETIDRAWAGFERTGKGRYSRSRRSRRVRE